MLAGQIVSIGVGPALPQKDMQVTVGVLIAQGRFLLLSGSYVLTTGRRESC